MKQGIQEEPRPLPTGALSVAPAPASETPSTAGPAKPRVPVPRGWLALPLVLIA